VHSLVSRNWCPAGLGRSPARHTAIIDCNMPDGSADHLQPTASWVDSPAGDGGRRSCFDSEPWILSESDKCSTTADGRRAIRLWLRLRTEPAKFRRSGVHIRTLYNLSAAPLGLSQSPHREAYERVEPAGAMKPRPQIKEEP
jgi:hypothetical protein